MSRPAAGKDVDVQMELLQKALDEAARLLIANLPLLKQLSLELLDTVFIPRTVAKQLLLAMALESGLLTLVSVTATVESFLSNFSSRSRLIAQLKRRQGNASTQDEWMELAERIDNIQGNDAWRTDPSCPLYEQERISARIDEFVHLMRRRDIFELMFVLRGGIARNKFGLLHEGLFSKALAGSKVLVETYHNVVCAALDFVCDAPVREGEIPIPTDARLAFFNETRHAYGRSALILSGGAALGFYHVGVVRALLENNLMPRVIGGSSAGSIVCSMIGTRTDAEILQGLLHVQGTNAPGHSGKLMLNFFRPPPRSVSTSSEDSSATGSASSTHQHKSDIVEVLQNSAGAFKDPKRSWQGFFPIGLRAFTSPIYDVLTGHRRPQDLLKNDTAHLRECCKANIGNFTFQEAFDRTGRILNIVVTPTNKGDPPRLLNYLTSPHVMVWSAAVASSSLPGVFEANRLMVKDVDGTERYESASEMKFSDGSMEQDLPMQQLSEMFNVNHFIISQANPHAVMLGNYNTQRSVWIHPVTGLFNSLLIFLKDQVKAWLTHVVDLVGGRRFSPLFGTQRDFGTQIFTQEYEGRECDISLVPWYRHRNIFSAFLHIIYNPSEAEFLDWIAAAERETWNYIPAIKSHIAEEVTLDRCVQRLRKRLAAESWELKRSLSEGKKITDRVPSFFTSSSLVNMSGLGVADRTTIEELRDVNVTSATKHEAGSWSVPAAEVKSGWGGLGLHGNRGSVTNLHASHPSGLFIDDEENQQQVQTPAQTSGEGRPQLPPAGSKVGGAASTADGYQGYVKTTNMADFYYRKTSTSDLRVHKSSSEHKNVGQSSQIPLGSPDESGRQGKSKSHADMHSTDRTGSPSP